MNTKSPLLALAAGTALLALAAPSFAAPAVHSFTPGSLQPGVTSIAVGDTVFNLGGSTEVSNTQDFTFTLTQTYNASSGGIYFEVPISPVSPYTLAISSTDLSLYSGTPGSGTLISTTGVQTLSPTGSTHSRGLTVNLSAGSYYVEDTITVPAGDVGQYAVTATVTAVSSAPEPSTWALLFAGVAMVGTALRLRRRETPLAA